MSAAGSHLGKQVAADDPARGRSPMAYLLHALNQPLTGLQCSLELSMAGPRTSEQYVSAMRAGLELTARMRVLVEAMGELAGDEEVRAEESEIVSLHALLEQTTNELQPIAEAKNASINFLRGLPATGASRTETACSLDFSQPGSVFEPGRLRQYSPHQGYLRWRAGLHFARLAGGAGILRPLTAVAPSAGPAHRAGGLGAGRSTVDQRTLGEYSDRGNSTSAGFGPLPASLQRSSDMPMRRLDVSVMTIMPVPPALGGALIASPSSALREQVLHHLNGRWQPVQQALWATHSPRRSPYTTHWAPAIP